MELTEFKCLRCQACCKTRGYVHLKSHEPDLIADFLGITPELFINQFTRLISNRKGLSLIEQEDGSCIFLAENGCEIHEVKPAQCRDFPTKWKFSDFESICSWARHQHGQEKVNDRDIKKNRNTML